MTELVPTPDEIASLLQVEHLLDQRWPETKLEPSTARISALMEMLGSPQSGYPSIHIAGTNGKTSVARLVNAPVAVITPIGVDHADYLGDTIAEIAGEKAGIITKQDEEAVPSGADLSTVAIIGRQTPEAMEVLLAQAVRADAAVAREDSEF